MLDGVCRSLDKFAKRPVRGRNVPDLIVFRTEVGSPAFAPGQICVPFTGLWIWCAGINTSRCVISPVVSPAGATSVRFTRKGALTAGSGRNAESSSALASGWTINDDVRHVAIPRIPLIATFVVFGRLMTAFRHFWVEYDIGGFSVTFNYFKADVK